MSNENQHNQHEEKPVPVNKEDLKKAQDDLKKKIQVYSQLAQCNCGFG